MTCIRTMTKGGLERTTWASPNSKALPGPSSASARNGTNANHYADHLLYAGKRPCLLTRMFACGHAHLPTGLSPILRSKSLNASAIESCRLLPCLRAEIGRETV